MEALKLRALYTIAGVIATPARVVLSHRDLGTGRRNRKEINRFEAGAAYQGTIDIRRRP
jgi:hypothetical protein